jgi:hypothetical protein
MSVSTAGIKGDGKKSLKHKYAVTWRGLCANSMAYQYIRVERMRKLRNFSGGILPRFKKQFEQC